MSKLLAPLFKLLGHVPPNVAASVGNAAGNLVGRLSTGSKEQLIKNHQRMCDYPITPAHVRRSFAAYFKMFSETPSLHRWTPQQIREAVTVPRASELAEDLKHGPVIVAMTHSGNWDLAGAWGCMDLATVVTVAEKLDPPELFEYFVDTREALGLEILAARRGVFHDLRERVKGRGVLVPLLADRDITGSGIEVDFGGHRALVAAGPAALANELEAPLWVLHMSSTADGKYTLNFERVTRSGDVEADTQAWVDAVVPLIKNHLADWHMLQPLFVEDLDTERLARARKRHAEEVEKERTEPAQRRHETVSEDAQTRSQQARNEPGGDRDQQHFERKVDEL